MLSLILAHIIYVKYMYVQVIYFLNKTALQHYFTMLLKSKSVTINRWKFKLKELKSF